MTVRRVLLLINNKSRAGSGRQGEVVRALQGAGAQVLLPSESESDPLGFSEAIRCRRGLIDCVAVGGGDGAMNAAIQGLLDTGLPLVVLPLGTANNLARTLGIPPDLSAACRAVTEGEARAVDLGMVNGLPFFNVSGMGLSTQINRQVPPRLKKRWGVLAFVWYGIKLLRRLVPFHAEVSSASCSLCLRAMQIIVCNGRHYGAGLTVREDAGIDDGRLDLCAVAPAPWYKAIGLAWAMRRGRYRPRHPIFLLSGAEIEIRTRRPMSIDIDGEVRARTPARFKVLPRAVTVLVPKGEPASAREPGAA